MVIPCVRKKLLMCLLHAKIRTWYPYAIRQSRKNVASIKWIKPSVIRSFWETIFGDQNFSTHSNIYWLALIEKRYWRMCHVTNSLTPLRKRRGYRRLSKYWAQVLGMHRLSFLLNWFLALHPVCNERPWKKIYIIQSLTDFRHFANWE